MTLAAPVPILRIFDEAKAREFYVDFLGFAVDWEHRFEAGLPLYMQISRDACVLHLTEHFGDVCPGAALRISVEDVDTWADALRAKDYKHARPGQPVAEPWGSRELSIGDPFGNRLTFYTTMPNAE